jgi:hypothetical protein
MGDLLCGSYKPKRGRHEMLQQRARTFYEKTRCCRIDGISMLLAMKIELEANFEAFSK